MKISPTASWYRTHYLKSSHWSDLRLKKLAETDARCETCGKQNFANDVHHIQYKNLWDVDTSDLRVLCRDCHNLIHDALENLKTYPRKEALEEWRNCVRIVRANIAGSFYPAWYQARIQLIAKLKDAKEFFFEDQIPPVNSKNAIEWFYQILKRNHREPSFEEWQSACDRWGKWPQCGEH